MINLFSSSSSCQKFKSLKFSKKQYKKYSTFHRVSESRLLISRHCSYQGIGMDDLNNHNIQKHVTNNDISHGNSEDPHIACDLCNKHVWKKRELTNHVNSDHKAISHVNISKKANVI